ncbi:MAG: MFS transporter [Acidobacteria bacterium]|nr:MFS transporter [Acidobacteriota bacterium]
MRAVTTRVVAPEELERWTEPWDGLVREERLPDGSFACAEGPFSTYRRVVTATPAPGGLVAMTSSVEFRLAIPYFGWLFAVPVRSSLRTPGARLPWWGPADRLDARASAVLGTLCAVSVIAGFLGTSITQTITYVSDDFHLSGDRPQSIALAVVRLSIVISLAVAAMADRQGRRRLLLGSAVAGCLLAVACAASPSFAAFTAGQTLLRGFSAATAILVTVVAAEEVPAGARAFAVSVVGMSAALGAGICVMALPLADRGESGWRLIYLIPLVALPVLVGVARRLPESKRFVRAHADAALAGHGQRLALLAVSLFLVQLFITPASQLQNEFLRDERHYGAFGITLFTLLTNTPAAIGIVAGGRLADVRGRRGVAAIGLIGGTIGTVVMYLVAGWAMWLWSLGAGIVGAATLPALGVYGPELWSRANGVLSLAAIIGSVVGLLAAGSLSDALGGLGRALAVLSVGPLALAALVLTRYPETAGFELEELNPEDAVTDPSTTG